MITKEKISELISNYLQDNSLFVVEINISLENDIEITIDSDEKVDIKHCVEVSRSVELGFNREEEDFSLTVSSAGLDQPLKVFRQYQKFVDNDVEVVFKSGNKVLAKLISVTPESIELQFTKLEKIEGKKRREKIEVKEFYNLTDIKSTKPFINFR